MRANGRMAEWMVLAGVLAAASGGAPARADDTASVMAGKQVAQTWCVNCHVVATTQVRGSDQAPTWTSIAALPGTTSASLHAFLAQPHGKMPDFKLSKPDIDNVVAYILSLKN
jgi:cytochrome c